MDWQKIAPVPKGVSIKPLDTTPEAEKIQLDIFRRMGPERQLADAFNVAKIRGSSLDRSYLRTWARELGVEDSLEEILKDLGD